MTIIAASSDIASYFASNNKGSDSVASMLNQIQTLQRKCADWEGCATTPTSEKQKIVSNLSQQIQVLQEKVDKVPVPSSISKPTEAINSSAAVQNNIHSTSSFIAESEGDGVNRPQADAISGSIINLSV